MTAEPEWICVGRAGDMTPEEEELDRYVTELTNSAWQLHRYPFCFAIQEGQTMIREISIICVNLLPNNAKQAVLDCWKARE